jgi:hypothetical protein
MGMRRRSMPSRNVLIDPGLVIGRTQPDRERAVASSLAVEQRSPRRDELEQDIVVPDIRGQHR